MKRAPGCVRGAAAGAGLPRLRHQRSRANPPLPATSSISYKKGDINTSTISNASRFIHRFCPGNRPAGRAGTRSARGGGGERGRPEPGMAAALGLQAEHASLLSSPTPLSPAVQGPKRLLAPRLPPGPGRAPRPAGAGEARAALLKPCQRSAGASAPAAAGREPCEATTETYEGLMTQGSRAAITWTYKLLKTTNTSHSPAPSPLSTRDSLSLSPEASQTAPPPARLPAPCPLRALLSRAARSGRGEPPLPPVTAGSGQREKKEEKEQKLLGCKRKAGGPVVTSPPHRAGARQQLPAGPAAGDPGDRRRCGGWWCWCLSFVFFLFPPLS